MPRRLSAKLPRWHLNLLTYAGGLLWLSGAVWLLLHYYFQTNGEFGPTSNPLEPWLLRLHGLVLIPALLGIGGLFVAHIPKGWTHPRQRTIGLILGGVLIVLIASGYLLYYVGGEDARPLISVIHWVIGLCLPLVYLLHRRRKKAR